MDIGEILQNLLATQGLAVMLVVGFAIFSTVVARWVMTTVYPDLIELARANIEVRSDEADALAAVGEGIEVLGETIRVVHARVVSAPGPSAPQPSSASPPARSERSGSALVERAV